MIAPFVWQTSASRVILRDGGLDDVPAEVARIGASRVVVVAGGAAVAAAAARLRAALGTHAVALVENAAPHVPAGAAAAAATQARDARADAVVSLGGGSATGLGKAVAVACDLPLLAVPTTFAGSEMTPVWARTDDGRKVTARDDRALPVAVVYDPALYRGMPPRLAAASGMNALAHCLETLWLATTSPMTAALAELGVRRLLTGLPRVVANPQDGTAHAETLVGACAAGLSFAQAGSGIHHRTCHVLGGGWSLPHAETHAILLPHSTALAIAGSPQVRRLLADLLGDPDPPQRIFELLGELQLPRSLADIGLPDDAVAEAVRRVLTASSSDPLADATSVTEMLGAAHAGRPPRR